MSVDESALMDAVADAIDEHVARAVAPLLAKIAALEAKAAMPARDGRDGMSIQGPAGERGLTGDKGMDGAPGRDGKDVDPEFVKAELARLVAQIPVPKDGRDGVDGKDGAPGAPGRDGARGEKGLDGANGRDGIDFNLQDIVGHEFDGQRTLRMKFARDERTYEADLVFRGTPVYQDVWKDGTAYVAGDVVTWGGGMWIAKDDTTAKPGLPTEASRAWRLCVKAGRDGKGIVGPQGPPGPTGPKGDRGPDRW